jgi:hypothetical protein
MFKYSQTRRTFPFSVAGWQAGMSIKYQQEFRWHFPKRKKKAKIKKNDDIG